MKVPSLQLHVLLYFALLWLMVVFVTAASFSGPSRQLDELDIHDEQEATGNFFGLDIGYFFECTLGLSYLFGFIPLGALFPSSCVCNETVLRREVAFAILFDIIPVCRNTNIKVTGDPIDINGRGFTIYCLDQNPVTCTLSKEAGTGPMFIGAPNGAGIFDLKLGPAKDGILELTGNGKAIVRRVEITGSTNGGAIRVTGANAELTMENSILTQNSATGNGGAIYVSGATKVNLAGLQFKENSTPGEGGALAVANGGKVTIKTSGFVGNTGTTANDIYIDGSSSTVTCLADGTGVQFCDGIDDAFDTVSATRTDCDTVGTTSGGICTA